jgi:thiol-disulfide isomerase/thioredoxin
MSILSILYSLGKVIFDYKIVLFAAVVFLMIALYYYRTVFTSKINKSYVDNKEFVVDEQIVENKTATLYYFYTTWCPLSKQANPEWQNLQTQTNGIVKNVNITFKEIDCDVDTATADLYKIEGYPTIKLVYDNVTYSYDAKPNTVTLLKFLNSVL